MQLRIAAGAATDGSPRDARTEPARRRAQPTRVATAAEAHSHDDAVLILCAVRDADGSLVDATIEFANGVWMRRNAPDQASVRGASFRRDFPALAADRWPLAVRVFNERLPLAQVFPNLHQNVPWGEVHVTPLDDDRLLVVARAVASDEAHREALRRSDARLRAAVEQASDTVAILRPVVDADGRLEDVEAVYLNWTARNRWYGGATSEELAGRRLFELEPRARAYLGDIYRGVFETGESYEGLHRFETPDGSMWARLHVALTTEGLVHTSRNVTEAVLAAEQAAASEKLLAAVMDSIDESVAVIRPALTDGVVTGLGIEWANRAWLRREGLDALPPDLDGMRMRPEFAALAPLVGSIVAGGPSFADEFRLGDGRWLAVSIVRLDDRVLAVSRDVTDRRSTDEATRARLVSAIENTSDAVSITGPDGSLVYVNRAFETLTGLSREAAMGRVPEIIRPLPDGTTAPILDLLRRGEAWRGVVERTLDDGRTVVVETTVSPVMDDLGGLSGVVAVSRDVTEARAEAARREHTERLEALGRLAGGIAHDFNNVLAAISGYGAIALEDLEPGSQVRDDVGQILAAADRAAALTRQLLAFSRRQAVQPSVVDPAAAAEALVPMLRRLIGEHVVIEAAFSPAAPSVLIDPGQFDQVLLNLALNARDAMPDGGRLDLRVLSAERNGRPHARLVVQDDGIGMDAEVRERIFEPFFTTKSVGSGTGLGLATVYGIVTAARGTIALESEPGVGSTFTVDLPAHEEPAVASVSAPSGPAGGGTERVLVVEDDPAVRAVVTRTLQKLGYTVHAAATADAALALVRHGTVVDLVISDVRMPSTQGPQLVALLRAELPGLRVLFMTGLLAELEPDQHTDAQVLEKPFDGGSLARAVRRALEAS